MEQTGKSAIPPAAGEPPAPVKEKDSVTQFLEVIGRLVPVDKSKLYLRATPHGVFVQKEFLPQIVNEYQNWFKEKTQQTSLLSVQKCMKRFFTSPQPPLFYLVEARQCMVGHLIRREISQPQFLSLPVYLGSVDDTRRIFHPRDPLLLCMPHVELRHNERGQEFKLTTARGSYRFNEAVLKEFSRLCQRSSRLAQQFPGQSGAIRDSFKSLVKVLEESRPAARKQRLLVPVKVQSRADVNYLCHGTLTFVLEDKDRITACYEVGSKTLFRFIKTEFAALHANPAERRRGSLEVLSPRERQLAAFQVKGGRRLLHPRSFTQFIRAIMQSAPQQHLPNEKELPDKYSVKEVLNHLFSLLQLAETIDRGKIARHVERIRSRHAQYYINGRWIFVFSRKNVLIACIDRYHQSNSQRGGRPSGSFSGGRRSGPRPRR